MIRKFMRKLKNKNSKNSTIQTDSVPEPSRHIVSSPIPCESSTSALVIPSLESYSTSPTQSSISSPVLPLDNVASPTSPSTQSLPTIQLSVSNSHGFHIGDVHCVTVSNGSTANFNTNESGLAALGKSLKNVKSASPSPSDSRGTDSLEYIYDKIKDWEISLICENVEQDCWKSIGIALNMEEKELIDCLSTADDSHHPKVFNILSEYVKKFPDTSLGYIVSILRETKQLKAIDKIAKLRL